MFNEIYRLVVFRPEFFGFLVRRRFLFAPRQFFITFLFLYNMSLSYFR